MGGNAVLTVCFFVFFWIQRNSSVWHQCELAHSCSLNADWLPGQRSQLSSHPAHGRSQGCSRRHGQAGLQHGAGGSVEAGGGHEGQHGHSHSQCEQNGDGGVNGHYLAELGERHNDAEEERDCGDYCGDGAGHYGNAHMVHRLQGPPLPLDRRLLQTQHGLIRGAAPLYSWAFRALLVLLDSKS